MHYNLTRKLISFSFIEFLGFPITMPPIFSTIQRKTKIVAETLEKRKKKTSTQRYNNLSLLEGFRRFLTCGSYGLVLWISVRGQTLQQLIVYDKF